METNRVFDRIPSFDERSRNFNVRALFAAGEGPRSYTWSCPANLDQGPDGACVGFAWAHEAAAKPQPIGVNYATALALYRAAQKVDEWPGEAYSGTSVLAGAKTAQTYGWLVEYRWAFNLHDALTAVSRHGPAVLGINWRTSMFHPDARGMVKADGQVVGGHAILLRGVNVKARTALLHNSWGPTWGGTRWGPGTALVSWDDLGLLLEDQGECCIPVVRRK